MLAIDKCEQVEADTAVFTIYGALRDTGYEEAVTIDSEDTDVCVQAARVSHHTPGLLGIKKKHQVMLCRSICNEDLAEVILLRIWNPSHTTARVRIEQLYR